ncbi:MAG: hypothetical protein QOK40_373 [Miltoncostaeaceae bacterium]|nr:hypothetical protein [Miltoncostaeaceae bacterium]
MMRTTLAAIALLALGAPVASAGAAPVGGFSMPPVPAMLSRVPLASPAGYGELAAPVCGTSQGAFGLGHVGSTILTCQGSGLTFVGPSVGQVASVIGPTIIGPAFIGSSIVSAGNVGIG